MRRRTKILLAVLAVVSVAIFFGLRWVWSTPGYVFKDSFAKANAGRYDDATEHLPEGNREQFVADRALMQEVWDTVTKKQTVAEVVVEKVDLDPFGMGWIHFIVKYQDGSSLDGVERLSRMDGRWTHGIHKFYDRVRLERRKAELATKTLSLAKDTRFLGRSVSLRLPEGLVWKEADKQYEHPQYGILIEMEGAPKDTMASLAQRVAKYWESPTYRFSGKQEFVRDKLRFELTEGVSRDPNGVGWQLMYLVVGDDKRAELVTAMVPNQDNFIAAITECLKSVRWED